MSELEKECSYYSKNFNVITERVDDKHYTVNVYNNDSLVESSKVCIEQIEYLDVWYEESHTYVTEETKVVSFDVVHNEFDRIKTKYIFDYDNILVVV
jgi:hypothetical protein